MTRKFNVTPLGPQTPETLLSQAQEIKWKHLLVIGILDDSEISDPKPGDLPTSINYTDMPIQILSWLKQTIDIELTLQLAANRKHEPLKG